MNVQIRKIYTSQKDGTTIDDTTISSTKTYSSEKIETLLSDVVQEEDRQQGNIVEFGANGIKNSGKNVSDFSPTGHTHNASNIPLDTSNLGGVLPNTLTNVQNFIDWIDDNIGFGGSILVGTTAPSNGIGNIGDIYIKSDGNIYQKNSGGSWVDTGVNIQGPVGPQGSTGPQGPSGTNGTNGTNGIDGANAPLVQFQYSVNGTSSWHTTFANGDKYLRTSVDGGTTWSNGIKFIGDEETKASILSKLEVTKVLEGVTAGTNISIDTTDPENPIINSIGGGDVEELNNVTSTDYTAPIDADSILTFDSINSLWKRLTFTNLKSFLKTYFDTLYTSKNTVITGATKTKITYDNKGLVTAGVDATTADISDSTNKRYVTDSQLTIIGNTSNTNTGDVTLAGTPNYITIVGQVITRSLINLASHVTGRLPFANIVAPTTTSLLLGRGTTAGDIQEITLGTNLSMTGNTLNAAGGGGDTYETLSVKPRTVVQWFEDFLNDMSSTHPFLDQALGGTGASCTFEYNGYEQGGVGAQTLRTGTTSTGYAFLKSGGTPIGIKLGRIYYENRVRIPVLSNSTQRFKVFLGLASFLTDQSSNAIGLLYDEGGTTTGSTASANWQIVTAGATTRTITNTSVAVGTSYVRVGFEVNSAGTSVDFYINGNLVGTQTTNLPSISTGLYFGVGVAKIIGTTNINIDTDYINVVKEFATPR